MTKKNNSQAVTGRFRFMNQQPVNLDGFATPAPELGLIAFQGPGDPVPSITIQDGAILEMDGRSKEEFDSIDEFIATHGIDITIAEESMGIDSLQFARQLVDPYEPRDVLVRKAAGMTPAKLAEVLGHLNAAELVMAMTKLRARKTPRRQWDQPGYWYSVQLRRLQSSPSECVASYPMRKQFLSMEPKKFLSMEMIPHGRRHFLLAHMHRAE
jgi:hypothetical protein